MLYSAFIELLREHPLERWPIGKIYIVDCQWLLFKDIFLFIFSWVCLQRSQFILSQGARAEGASEALHVAVQGRETPKLFQDITQ